MKLRVVFLLSILLAFSTSIINGQVSTSRLTGTVQDSSGAVVPGATVTIRNEETGATRTSTLAEAGTYTFDALPTGLYTVEVEASGFKKTASAATLIATLNRGRRRD